MDELDRPPFLNVFFWDLGSSEESIQLIGNLDEDFKPSGNSWSRELGSNESILMNGWLYGPHGGKNDSLRITGDECIFLYPDMETALVGQFHFTKMINARETRYVIHL